ncbi:V/A-type H+-transporting ATPase subunit E [Anaerosphaera aminiphila DSM 21120]|uniref:V/A-type H+-transporting ATPase subunit E n=1 Tax=Anaerosphaera aminiphila DSM 21120 TaxID=1120995 RepID=A0A1M5UAM3_9FIRM|nr:V-type ATP synthase subunit E [Anaerosphaera aminiphila]SHH60017.1 V/A-type H+-transporting ATPase subunit E [Anaerosphaera aminiphila DSM 21120]
MSSVDNLTNKIEEDATREVRKIMVTTENEAYAIVTSKEEEARADAKRLMDRKKLEAVETEEKIVSSATLEARDLIIKSKEEVVDRVFKSALSKLENLSEEEYVEFLKKSLETIGPSEDCILMVPEKYIEAVKRENLKVQLSDEFVSDGFSLINGTVLYNNKFSSLIDDIKVNMESEIFDKIFQN